MTTPIPQRIPPLIWRRPAFLWTPLALAIAVGWPLALLRDDPALANTALVAGAVVYALALVSLGAAWVIGRAPRTRRDVVMHILAAGALTSLAAPFVLTRLLGAVADYEQTGAAEAFSMQMSLAMTPLALVLGLPIALASGIVFAVLALTRPKGPSAEDVRHGVQPFR